MTDADSTRAPGVPDGDALAALIRAAGRRPTPSAEEYERVRLASHLAWQVKVHNARRRRVLWFALAAGMTAAVVGALTWQTAPAPIVAELALLRGRAELLVPGAGSWRAPEAGVGLVAGTRLRTLGEGGAAFTIGDGISVRAPGATSWTFDDATRLTLDVGTLYVDTGPGGPQAGAIEIATPLGVVRDFGTQFEVRTVTGELRVRVREGSVQLRTSRAASAHAAPAGEELLLAADGAIARRPIAADAPEWEWAETLATPLELGGGSAFDALQWVARELGKRLVFEDASTELLARNAIIHGNSAGLEPLQILEVVMATSAVLEYTLGDGTLVIRRR
jgi:hypothetical protein